MAPNDYNFIGSGRDFKQLFYILDYRTQKHQSAMLPGALPHYPFRVLLLNRKNTASLSAISLIHKRDESEMFQSSFSSKNLCYMGRYAVRDIKNGH